MMLRACAFLAGLLTTCAFAQTSATDAAKQQQIANSVSEAAAAGVQLTATSNVTSSLNIEAVMLPSDIVKRVFGNDVATQYAVIEVNIANRNPASAFILESLYIDYEGWALGNGFSLNGLQSQESDFTKHSKTMQVSSVEYRIIRGEVMDRQPFTARNLILNTMKGVGATATAFAFPFTADVARGISAWNGGVVPALDTYWPDSTQGQLNRISDYGFRNNKVIPQQSADIVVAFFPINRFLSNPLKKVFLKDPAAFFNPIMLAIDSKQKEVEGLLKSVLGSEEKVTAARENLLSVLFSGDPSEIPSLVTQTEVLNKAIGNDRAKLEVMTDKEKLTSKSKVDELNNDINAKQEKLTILYDTLKTKFDPSKKGYALFRLLTALSLSNVTIAVGGTMNTDEQNIPASLTQSCFDPSPAPPPELWAEPGPKTCAIHGSFLLNGIPKLLNTVPADLGITDITVKTDASSADLLTFTYNLTTAIDPPKFDLVVTKSGKNGTSVDSMKYGVGARTTSVPAPTITSAATDGTGADTKYIITGTNFFDVSPNNSLSVSLTSSGISPIVVPSTTRDTRTQITLPATSLQSLAAGCYSVSVNEKGSSTATNAAVNLKVTGTTTKTITAVATCP